MKEMLTTMVLLTVFLWYGCPDRNSVNSFSSPSPSRTVESVDLVMANSPSPSPSPSPVPTRSQAKITSIKGGPICQDYILQKVAKEKTSASKLARLRSFNTKDKTLSQDLVKWLETADDRKLAVFELRSGDKKALILSSRNVEATGLASNLEYWYVEIEGNSTVFQSLSKDPFLIFWGKDGLLNYWVIDYSDEFVNDKDWDNITLDLEHFVLDSDGNSQLMKEEKYVKCK